ncbi:MAG: hypothetical protein K0R63_1050 [Rickettsiales bacterium]|jgi:hypothetical protein|nr:hypothetical protein [Rickettsiales bacterium]
MVSMESLYPAIADDDTIEQPTRLHHKKSFHWFRPSYEGLLEMAQTIRNSVNYRALRAAWDEFVTIQRRQGSQYTNLYTTATPEWFGLQAIINYKGKLESFAEEELEFLRGLRHGDRVYDDIITALSQLLIQDEQSTPEPSQNLNGMDIIQQLRDYQEQLQKYNALYGKQIDRAIAQIEKRKRKQS